jgi:hypothetical protein
MYYAVMKRHSDATKLGDDETRKRKRKETRKEGKREARRETLRTHGQ